MVLPTAVSVMTAGNVSPYAGHRCCPIAGKSAISATSGMGRQSITVSYEKKTFD